MAEVLKVMFVILEVKSSTVVTTETNDFEIKFPIKPSKVEIAIKLLNSLGVGKMFGTYSIFPTEICKDSNDMNSDGTFAETVKSRMVLFETLVSNISDGADFSFDYVVLLITAGIIAGSGLATNNPVMVVAAMLVSPLMGPILAMTFGVLIHDWILVKKGIINEIYGILICIFVGLCCGAVAAPFLDEISGEMASRGNAMNLLIGLSIAIPSGVGVALSMSQSNTSSLVGVAISASLLPPAVNAGELLMYGFIGPAIHGNVDRGDTILKAFISLCLTLSNILCIIIFGAATFYIKEVAPIPGKTAFWDDVKTVRHRFDISQKTIKANTETTMKLHKDLKIINKVRKEKEVTTCCCIKKKVQIDYDEIENILRESTYSPDATLTFRSPVACRSVTKRAKEHRLSLMSVFNAPDPSEIADTQPRPV